MLVRFLGWEDPLEKGMATHSSVSCLENPWTEEPGGLSPLGRKESDTSEVGEHTGRGYGPGVSHITSFTSDEKVTRGLASK